MERNDQGFGIGRSRWNFSLYRQNEELRIGITQQQTQFCCLNIRLTDLYKERAHRIGSHWSLRATLAEFRSKYWVPQARQQIKKIRRDCVICKRYEGKPYQAPQVAALPRFRVTEARPFQRVGIDFAGLLYVKKNKRTEKVYICLLTCAVSRAVHLEMLDSLNISDFLLCFWLLAGRCGMPGIVVSDNAKTFKAGSTFVSKLMAQLSNCSKHLASLLKGIQNLFINIFAYD